MTPRAELEPTASVVLDRATQADVGAAADRYARIFASRSRETQRTYRSVYRRLFSWLAAYTCTTQPEAAHLTADAVAAYFDGREAAGIKTSTLRKEKAALNALAKYLHNIGALDATEILMVPTRPPSNDEEAREALDEDTWERVKSDARARLSASPKSRASRPAAARDLAMILLMGDMGLRSGEVRSLYIESYRAGAPTQPARLRIVGKGHRERTLKVRSEVDQVILAWEGLRPSEAAADPYLFPRLGRRRTDGGFPDAGGKLTHHALIEVVRPIMMRAGVPKERAHPHVLRHTFATLSLRKAPNKLAEIQAIMGHASISTTQVYLHQTVRRVDEALDELDRQSTDLRRRARRGR